MLKLGKKWRVVGWVTLAITLMGATIPLAIWLTHTQTAEFGNARARCETGLHDTHRVIIENNTVIPVKTYAHRCDLLIITNLDSKQRLLAFGPHNQHISYDGISEQLVGQNQSLTVHLIRSGSFTYHDHDDDAVTGTFAVTD